MKKLLAGIISAVFVLASTVNLTFAEPFAVSAESPITETYRSETSKIVNAPTVICDVVDHAALEKLDDAKERPSNVILRFDKNHDIVGISKEILGSFDDIYTNYLEGRIIPILYIESEESADAVTEYLEEERSIFDIAVMSDDPSLVKRVKEATASVRGIVRYPEKTSLKDVVRTTNLNFANVAVLPQSMATQENVRYIQARFKTVWIEPNGSEKRDLYECINSGAYGLVVKDFSATYRIMETYKEKSATRTPFNVAHRGLPKWYNENSVSGVEAAIAAGATHLELDGYLTTDKEIVLMHDPTLERTTTGSLIKTHLEAMSLAQIRQYKLNQYEEEEIPILDDILNILKGTDIVLIFEVKSEQEEIIAVLKSKLEKYECFDNVTVISFHPEILEKMKEMLPEIPTANLNAANIQKFGDVLRWMGEYNTGVDTSYGNTSVEFNEQYLRDRGIIGWYWTFDNDYTINFAFESGYTGLTNNIADSFTELFMYVKSADKTTETLKVGDEIVLKGVTYAYTEQEIVGEVFFCEDKGDYYEVVASYPQKNVTIYTQYFKVSKVEEISKAKSGCGNTIGLGFGVLGLTICLWPLFSKEKNKILYGNFHGKRK